VSNLADDSKSSQAGKNKNKDSNQA